LILAIAEGEKALDKFLDDIKKGGRKAEKAAISPKIRSMIRNIQPFVPRAATTNRDLARHCLLTTSKNYLCSHHQAKAKRAPITDGENKKLGGYAVTGVPHSRIVNPKLTKPGDASKTGDEIDGTTKTPAKGYLHCGCKEDDVLAEFYFWKTWTVTSPTTGVTEGWLDQGFDPRARVFVVSAIKDIAKLNIDDLYTNGLDDRTHKKKLLELQISRMEQELKNMDDDEAEGSSDEEDGMELSSEGKDEDEEDNEGGIDGYLGMGDSDSEDSEDSEDDNM
jgi:hypothetical protein